MKYKLLQNAPNAKKEDIFDLDAGSRFEFYTFENASYHKDDVENNPEWFAPFCFTTEDGVDVYIGDTYFVCFPSERKTYGAYIATNDGVNWDCPYLNFSTREAAEKYLEPKFKVGDYLFEDNSCVIFKVTEEDLERVNHDDYSYCYRKAINEEIIKYYSDLGWKIGAAFKEKGQTYVRTIELIEYDACTNIVWIVGQYPNKIEECELIVDSNYPKSWEDLKAVKGWFINIDSTIYYNNNAHTTSRNKNIFITEKQAVSAIAFAQLSQLVAKMNGDWKPNWNDSKECKYIIDREYDTIVKCNTSAIFHPLPFKTAEARDFSFEHHKQLWEQLLEI